MREPQTRRTRLIVAGLLASLVLTAAAAPVLAGKRGGNTSAASSLAREMVLDRNASGTPNWNDQLTFLVSTTATSKPWVRLDCYQSGVWVSTNTHGFFADYPWDPVFTLASGGWMSGAADCTATLYQVTSNGRSRTLAQLTFHVDP